MVWWIRSCNKDSLEHRDVSWVSKKNMSNFSKTHGCCNPNVDITAKGEAGTWSFWSSPSRASCRHSWCFFDGYGICSTNHKCNKYTTFKKNAIYADSCHRIPRKSSELTAMSPWVPPVVVSFFANIRPLLPPLLRAVGFSHVWNGLWFQCGDPTKKRCLPEKKKHCEGNKDGLPE